MKTAFIVSGSPGSGKSTYGLSLAKKRAAAFLDIDTVTERMVKTLLKETERDPNDRDSSYFKDILREPVYSTLFDIAQENLLVVDVVIVGPFTREIKNEKWPEELKSLLNSNVEFHHTFCPLDVRKQRIIDRGNPRDIPKLENWDEHVKWIGQEKSPVFDHLFVDTSKVEA